MVEQPLVEGINVEKHYWVKDSGWRKKKLTAVNGVSIQIFPQEVVGIVGESGCGKSTLARCLTRMETLTKGKVFFAGEDVTSHREGQLREKRQRLQMVFQEPYAALNPLRTVGESIGEPLENYSLGTREEVKERVCHLMKVVELDSDWYSRYPHQFSGGQLQRVNIARALATQPEVLVCDEAIANLDGIVKNQIVELLARLRLEYRMSYLFISHDLRMVEKIADRVAVMVKGRIVEWLPGRALATAVHPYTRYLLRSSLSGNPHQRRIREKSVDWREKQITAEKIGCAMQGHCPDAGTRCREEEPVLQRLGNALHQVACHQMM